MKIALTIVLSVIASLIVCRTSLAAECRSDLDCKMYEGEKCIKKGDENVGTCIKTEFPQKKESSGPAQTPPSSSMKRGHFCSEDKDCDPGQSCVKKENGMFGACF